MEGGAEMQAAVMCALAMNANFVDALAFKGGPVAGKPINFQMLQSQDQGAQDQPSVIGKLIR